MITVTEKYKTAQSLIYICKQTNKTNTIKSIQLKLPK